MLSFRDFGFGMCCHGGYDRKMGDLHRGRVGEDRGGRAGGLAGGQEQGLEQY